jgi:hypothetical protein
MGKMMPLKWIEQAEAREVCVIALSEAAVAPEPPMAPISLVGSLLRLRARPAPLECGRNDPKPSLDGVVPLRRVRRVVGRTQRARRMMCG